MDRIDVSDFGGRDDPVDAEIAIIAWAVPNADGFIGYLNVHRICVGLGVNGNGFDVQFATRADDAHGDFATIGDQDFFKHKGEGSNGGGKGRLRQILNPPRYSAIVWWTYDGRILNRVWPNSTGLAFSDTTALMTPRASALISFITFIASMMQTTVSGLTSVPTSTYGAASGEGER